MEEDIKYLIEHKPINSINIIKDFIEPRENKFVSVELLREAISEIMQHYSLCQIIINKIKEEEKNGRKSY